MLADDNSSTRRWTLGNRSEALNFYALAAAIQGHHREAASRIGPALAFAIEAGSADPNARINAWLARHRVAEMAGDTATARHAALQALQTARELELVEYEADATIRLGDLAEQRGAWDQAAAEYNRAIDLQETRHEAMGLRDWNAQAFASLQEPYRGLIRVQLATGDARGALGTLDQTQARYLRDLRNHLALRERLSSAQRSVADSLVNALEAARLALLNRNTGGGERAALMQTAAELQTSLEEVTESRSLPPAPLDVSRVQKVLLTEGRTLIAYFLDDRKSTAFVVRPDTVVAVPLQTSESGIRDLLRAVGSRWDEDGVPDPAFALGPLHDLYRTVVEPVMPWIPDDTRALTIVPDGVLAAVPLSMLLTAPAESYEEAPYLVRRFPIAYELATSLVGTENEREAPPELDLLAYGRSQFDTPRVPEYERHPLIDLPFVKDELRRVTRQVQDSRVVTGDEATEASLRHDLGTARIVHVASHAEVHPTLPLYSRIYLRDDPEDRDDGVLYLYEIQSQSLPADLVVLSGCSTASGQAGEGINGLQYAVRTAGAHASLATLWPVDDHAVADLMGEFYNGLTQGLSKDEALQRAQLAYLEQSEGLAASPFYWAAPVLSGDPSPVPIDGTGGAGWILAVLLGGLGAGLAWFLRTRPSHA